MNHARAAGRSPARPAVTVLIVLMVLPLAVIGLQLHFDLAGRFGLFGYSLYKLCFLLPPLLYCHLRGIGVRVELLRFGDWRRRLPWALGLGGLAAVSFWGLFLLLGDRLLDKARIVDQLGAQFSVTAKIVVPIGLFTIVVNSLLEEFFYRGFGVGLLRRRSRLLAALLPAAVFTAHHLLFLRSWLDPLPLTIAAAGLLVFALALAWLYEQAGSIVAPWVTHVIADLAMMSIAASMLLG